MKEWTDALTVLEPVSILVLLLLIGSLIQGMLRGASSSARRLFYFVWDGLCLVISILLAARGAVWLSPIIQRWLIEREIVVPQEQLTAIMQLWYTFITAARDFSLMRTGLVFLLLYFLLRLVFAWMTPLAAYAFASHERVPQAERVADWKRTLLNRSLGASIGALHGIGRAFVLIAVLFIYVSLLPQGPLTTSIKSSPVFAQASDQIFAPVAGAVIEKQGPVLTQAVESEFRRILQRKYEIIDYAVPAEVEQAAQHITEEHQTSEEKARALYDWLGSRITYDWDKARNYEQHGIWKEQTPEQTFHSRSGVCIDVARLYAVMARSAGLEVRVVTGLGADGRGGYGPHAWNEVLISEHNKWVPLDATWASSGEWFNPPNFEETHIREI